MQLPTYDCMACGGCCAYSADWPEVRTQRDKGALGPPAELVTEDGYLQTVKNRCVALEGTLGERVSCTIYDRRPQACRGCEVGSTSCHAARTALGLPIEVPPSDLDALFPG